MRRTLLGLSHSLSGFQPGDALRGQSPLLYRVLTEPLRVKARDRFAPRHRVNRLSAAFFVSVLRLSCSLLASLIRDWPTGSGKS